MRTDRSPLHSFTFAPTSRAHVAPTSRSPDTFARVLRAFMLFAPLALTVAALVSSVSP